MATEIRMESASSGSSPGLRVAVAILALLMVLSHMVYTQYMFVNANLYFNMHLGFALSLIFLARARDLQPGIRRWVYLLAFVVAAVCAVYVHVMEPELRVRTWFNTPVDLAVGLALIVLSLWASGISFGWTISLLAVATVIYPFFAQSMPEPWTAIAYPLDKTISNLSIGLSGGIYSQAIQASADYIFLFVVFSAVLGATGMQQFFYELSKLLGKIFRTGTGIMSVIAAALVGGFNDSALSDAIFVGSYTIQSLKKAGYKAESAAALAAAAANGAQITPPILGVVAFSMAAFSGVSYLRIMVMCLIPSFLYYLGVCVYTHFHALREGINDKAAAMLEPVNKKELLYRAPGFVIPVALIIGLQVMHYSVMTTAFWAILVSLALSFMVPKTYRPTLSGLVDGFVRGALTGSQIAAVSAVVGLMITTFSSSGLGVKLSAGIEEWSGGHLFIALFIIWAVSIVLGMIGVSAVAYFTTAAFAVPVLVKFGVPFETAHFFIAFPTIFALITPPVALVSLVTARMAEAKYGPSAIDACKAAIASFFLPFMFVYAPTLVLSRSAASSTFWIELILAMVLIACLSIAMAGYLIVRLHWLERILMAVASGGMLSYLALRMPVLLLGGVIIVALVVAAQLLRKRYVQASLSSMVQSVRTGEEGE